MLVSFLQRRIVFSNLAGSSARNLRLEHKKKSPDCEYVEFVPVDQRSSGRSSSASGIDAAKL